MASLYDENVIPEVGTLVRVIASHSVTGIITHQAYIDNRRDKGATGAMEATVPGHGGDVLFVCETP